MTDSTNPARARPEQPERLSLSATQILASGLAAVSATVAASYFGVAGTVIGAGLGSVISVVGSAVYSYSIRQTHTRVRQGLDVAVSQRFSVNQARPRPADHTDPHAPARPATAWSSIRASVNPRRLALASAAMFLLVLAVTTGFELASGQPLAATVSGKHGSGTSLDGGRTGKPNSPSGSTSAPAGSASPAGSRTSSSTGGTSAAPTVTVTVPASTSPTTPAGSNSPTSNAPSSSPTPAPTSTPSG